MAEQRIPRDIHEVIERIRPKPMMWLASRSLHSLWLWLSAYDIALMERGFELERGQPSFDYFNTFIQKKLGFGESTAGWANMICDRVGDDSGPALERFYELFDEFRALGAPTRVAETVDPTVITKPYGTSVDAARRERPRFPTHLELRRFPPPLGVFLVMRFPWGTDERFVTSVDDGYALAERWFGVLRHGWRSIAAHE